MSTVCLVSFAYWWLVRVTLLVAFGFLHKILGDCGTYELSFCSKRNAASVVLTMLGGGDIQTLQHSKKKIFELYALAGGRDAKTF